MPYPRSDYIAGDTLAAADFDALVQRVTQHSSALGSSAPELFHDFTKDPNGPLPSTADTGQTWTFTYGGNAAALPTIVSGAYTNTYTGASTSASSYLTAQLPGSVTYMGGEVDFGATGTTPGSAVLVAWTANLTPNGLFSGTGLGTPCHCVINSGAGGYLQYGVGTGGVLTYIGDYPFNLPNATKVRLEILIDKVASTSYVRGPDGKVVAFTDPLIGSLTAAYPCAEIYYGAASTAQRTNFRSFSASSTPQPSASVSAADTYRAQLGRIVTVTGNYTLKVPDAFNVVEVNSPSAATITIPPDVTTAFPANAWTEVCQVGAGQVTVVAGSGVTLQPGSLATRARYSSLYARKRAANTWLLSGDFA